MRKSTLISLLLALVLLGGVTIWHYMPRTLSYDECSPVYRHFADMQLDGVRITYIKDKIINDTLRLPVTLIEAETDRGWEQLDSIFLKEYMMRIQNSPDIPDDFKQRYLIADTCFLFYRANRETPEKQAASADFRPDDVTVCVFSPLRRITIFEPRSIQKGMVGDVYVVAFDESFPDAVTQK